MSNVVIFHGTDCKPEDFWYQTVQKELVAAGHTVELPYYKDINKIAVEDFIQHVMDSHTFDEDTILIGHSAGVPLILSILERIKLPIKLAILVAGFSSQLSDDTDEPILQSHYDCPAIKKNAQDFVIFNSPNDPWGCDDTQGRRLFDQLGGTLIIRNDGHFGSSKDPDYKEFPLLVKMIGAIS
jgi:predicted alpha/beta hydrolase family esterase